MSKTCVRAADPPGGKGAVRYAGGDLLDSFVVDLPPGSAQDIGRLAELALSEQPKSFRTLMAVRDTIMARFGVKTSGAVRVANDGLLRIDFFPILAISDCEIELGYDDVHLDFRAWLTLIATPQGRRLQSTTVARAHNLLGRLYLVVIGPFHVTIVKAGLRRAAQAVRFDCSSAG